MPQEQPWCVVTGGRGFAGRHLVNMILRSKYVDFRVRVSDLPASLHLDPDEDEGTLGKAIRDGRAVYVAVDLTKKSEVFSAFQGAEAVFHMAAPDSSINSYKLHYAVNVEGTRNVIDACIQCKVKRLIYTSSPSVVFDAVHGVVNVDESIPYTEKFNDTYSETKAQGEKLVIKANGRDGLLTCCIRPSSIFGPGDKLLVPSLVAAAKAGKGKYIIGDGNNVYDFTYVENVAYAHICAERTLATEDGAKKAGGQAYFITNMEPIRFWEFMSLVLEGLGYERPSIKIPASVMMPIAHLVEWTYKLFAKYGMRVPQLTPSRIRLLSCNRTFNCSKAKDHLGYEPIVSLKDGLKKTIESYSHLKAEMKKIPSTSKAFVYLGGGKMADTLLWKDKKQTFTAVLLLVALYYYVFSSGYTFITAMAKLFSMFALFLFIHGTLPAQILKYKIEKIPPSYFHLSRERAHRLAFSARSYWNSGIDIIRSFCMGKDWSLFSKVVFFLLVLNILGAMSLQTAYKIVVPLCFIVFFAYEKMEDDIDRLLNIALSHTMKLKADVFGRVSSH